MFVFIYNLRDLKKVWHSEKLTFVKDYRVFLKQHRNNQPDYYLLILDRISSNSSICISWILIIFDH